MNKRTPRPPLDTGKVACFQMVLDRSTFRMTLSVRWITSSYSERMLLLKHTNTQHNESSSFGMLKQFLRRNNASCAFSDVRRLARRQQTASLELRTLLTAVSLPTGAPSSMATLHGMGWMFGMMAFMLATTWCRRWRSRICLHWVQDRLTDQRFILSLGHITNHWGGRRENCHQGTRHWIPMSYCDWVLAMIRRTAVVQVGRPAEHLRPKTADTRRRGVLMLQNNTVEQTGTTLEFPPAQSGIWCHDEPCWKHFGNPIFSRPSSGCRPAMYAHAAWATASVARKMPKPTFTGRKWAAILDVIALHAAFVISRRSVLPTADPTVLLVEGTSGSATEHRLNNDWNTAWQTQV